MALLVLLAGCAPERSLPAGDEGWPQERAGWAFLTELDALGPGDRNPREKLRVVATTTIVGDVVANVGGDEIDLRVLIPPGTDPHIYEPSPGDLADLSDADVVFINGLGLEAPLRSILRNASEAAPVVSLSQGVEPLPAVLPAGARPGGPEEPSAGAPDPHVWLDPLNVLLWAGNAAAALGAMDPAHAATYEDNARAYQEVLGGLDAWIESQLGEVGAGKQRLVSDHQSLAYFAQRYGLQIVGTVLPGVSTASQPSAIEFARLLDKIRELDVEVVFIDPGANPSLVEQVAAETGVQLVPLYVGSLSPPQGPAPTYVALMKYNVRAMVDALR